MYKRQLLAILVALFAVQNSVTSTVAFLPWRFESSLAVVLVTFAPQADWKFEHLLEMKGELESLIGRTVDLVCLLYTSRCV